MALLNEDELTEEVKMVEKTLRVKLCMQRLMTHSHSAQVVGKLLQTLH
jgi:hypothetical protein